MNQPINVGVNPLIGNNPLRAPNFDTFTLVLIADTHILNHKLDYQYLRSEDSDGPFFIAKKNYLSKFIDAVFKSIKEGNEEKFITATVNLAASHPVYNQRNIVLESFPELFIAKEFKIIYYFPVICIIY